MEDVCELLDGFHLLREPNGVGGYTYYTDELGAMVWDTCIVDEYTLMIAIAEEKRRTYLEYHINKRLIGANKVWDLLIKEAGASENDRSEFLLWFKTSLPFYPQNLMTANKKQLFAKEFRFNGKLGFSSRVCFCSQMIKAHIKGKCSVDQLVREINTKLKLISC